MWRRRGPWRRLRVPEMDHHHPHRQAKGRDLGHPQPAYRKRPCGREQRGQERHGDGRGGLERPGRAPAECQVAHQEQGQSGREQEGNRSEPDQEQRPLLVGEPLSLSATSSTGVDTAVDMVLSRTPPDSDPVSEPSASRAGSRTGPPHGLKLPKIGPLIDILAQRRPLKGEGPVSEAPSILDQAAPDHELPNER